MNNIDFYNYCKNNDIEKVKEGLKDSNVDPTAYIYGNTSLIVAIYNGHIEIVDLLLNDSRIDSTLYKNKALYYATILGEIEIIEKLIKCDGVNPNDRGDNTVSALVASLNKSNPDITLLFLKKNLVDLNVYLEYILIEATKYEYYELVEYCLVNYKDRIKQFNIKYIIKTNISDNADILDLYYKYTNINLSMYNNMFLKTSIIWRNYSVVKYLIKNKQVQSKILKMDKYYFNYIKKYFAKELSLSLTELQEIYDFF